uniref:WD repeat-containing protein 75 second beta-propeller domain-containing protein n=1 Tax=Peronospora matthiolae TaxID=2874970 RepID=A0AAV1UZS4_9STRA
MAAHESPHGLELLTPPPVASPPSTRVGLTAATLVSSSDGRYVFQRQGPVVRVLQGTSGRVLHECARPHNLSPVSAIAPHPLNALQLVASYEDGYILIWDFVAQTIHLATDKVGVPILWMATSRSSPSHVVIVVKSPTRRWRCMAFDLEHKERGRVFVESDTAFQTAALQSYSSSPSEAHAAQNTGDYLVLAAGRSIFTGWLHYEPSSTALVTQQFQHVRDVTCIAVSPVHVEFSIGDREGQMFRYDHHALRAKRSAAKLHWHSHAVHCLQYSSDGQHLLSGGEECVLVTWQLETGRRSYLPRLPASVEVIAPKKEGGVYVVGLADNVVFQYNPVTREQEWEARGLARAGGAAVDSLPMRQLAVDPISKALVINGSLGAGVLQFYEPFADRVLQTLVLSERNQVTRTDDEVMPTLVASHSRFSFRGSDLVTLHAPTTVQDGNEQALRFWTRRVDGSFFVNTSVDAPHGRARVTRVAFSPTAEGDCVVTADDHGDFKVWQKVAAEAGGVSWLCQSVVRFRDEPVTAVSFARDGSLLAVAYGNKLTLWDIATHSLRRVLCSSDGQKINQVMFPGVNSPYVVVMTQTQVQVWSLLSLSLSWRYNVPKSTAVAEEALHERFLIWMPVDEKKSKKTLLLVFDPQTPVPTCIRVVDFGSKVWTAGFHPGTGDIVLVDDKTGIWRLNGFDANSVDAKRRKQAYIAAVAASVGSKNREEDVKVLSTMYDKSSSSSHLSLKKTDESEYGTATNGSASDSLFDAPAHVLPSMTALYRPFMDTMLPKPHRVDKSGDAAKNVNGEAASTQKKKNKRHKKQLAAQQQQESLVDNSIHGDAEQRKRIKLLVEKELANPELQQQTYSKLLETFRKSKARQA